MSIALFSQTAWSQDRHVTAVTSTSPSRCLLSHDRHVTVVTWHTYHRHHGVHQDIPPQESQVPRGSSQYEGTGLDSDVCSTARLTPGQWYNARVSSGWFGQLIDAMEMFYWFCYWTLIWLSPQCVWLCQAYWHYINFFDWLISEVFGR